MVDATRGDVAAHFRALGRSGCDTAFLSSTIRELVKACLAAPETAPEGPTFSSSREGLFLCPI